MRTKAEPLDPKTVAEALRQVIDGDDFYGPKAATLRVTDGQAQAPIENAPYSIATNAEHTVFWNRLWIARLRGAPRPNLIKDWRVPEPGEWKRIRKELIETTEEAYKIANAEPFTHQMKSHDIACKTLLAIAVHTAYHLGQLTLLKKLEKNQRS